MGLIEDTDDLRSVARSYGELRSQAVDDFRRMDQYALVLFKAFLGYVKMKEDGHSTFPGSLGRFFSEDLGLDSEDDMGTRLSLARRFHNLSRKYFGNSKVQRSLLPYLEH